MHTPSARERLIQQLDHSDITYVPERSLLMNHKSLVLALCLILPLPLISAAETSVLLKGKIPKMDGERTSIAGEASAIIKGGGDETRVSAEKIAFDPEGNVLACAGDAVVTSGGRTFRAKDITIELGSGKVRVFLLNPSGILSLGAQNGFESWQPGAAFVPAFGERMPGVNYDLKRANKMPHSTSTPFAFPAVKE
jgi:hypothetical protein